MRMPTLPLVLLLSLSCLAADAPKAETPAPPALPMPPTVAEGAALKTEYEEKRWFEGPVWDPAGKAFYFTSHGGKTNWIMRLDGEGKATKWWDETGGIGGLWVAGERVYATQSDTHKVVSFAFAADGPKDVKVLHADQSLHQPNDLCRLANGNIYFTDPDFKGNDGEKTGSVWLLAPEGKATKVVADLGAPNGIAASPDGKTLYLSDSDKKQWWKYAIRDGGALSKGEAFFTPESRGKGNPDGMSVDEQGNVYASGLGGVWAVSPEGKTLGFVPVPEPVSNVAFGGEDFKTLYLTCGRKVYSLRMAVAGSRAGM